jgi:tetratricopeptide (TPR) repeat protein
LSNQGPVSYLTRALVIREKVLGHEHPETATPLNDLAFLYQTQGRNKEAEPLYQRALAIYEKTLPPDHPYTAITLENYASLLRKMNRAGEAQVLEQRAKEIRDRRSSKRVT